MFSMRLLNQRGTVTVVVVMMLIVLLSFAALAVDIGHMMVMRNELQNVADAAALAGAAKLGQIYSGMTYSAQRAYTVDADRSAIVAAAQELASRNYVADKDGNTIAIYPADVRIGIWISGSLYTTSNAPTAVQVTVRREGGTTNGPVSTVLAGLFGVDTMSVRTVATASLGSLLKTPEGGVGFPIGISTSSAQCDKPITFNPTASCAGWNTLTDPQHDAHTLAQVINGEINGTYESPSMTAGLTELNFTGGNDASVFDDMERLFNVMKKKDNDGNDATWTTVVPVYYDQSTDGSCANPSGWITIAGFTTIVVTNVLGPPDMLIQATISCDNVVEGQSGGAVDYGTIGTKPNLVQ